MTDYFKINLVSDFASVERTCSSVSNEKASIAQTTKKKERRPLKKFKRSLCSPSSSEKTKKRKCKTERTPKKLSELLSVNESPDLFSEHESPLKNRETKRVLFEKGERLKNVTSVLEKDNEKDHTGLPLETSHSPDSADADNGSLSLLFEDMDITEFETEANTSSSPAVNVSLYETSLCIPKCCVVMAVFRRQLTEKCTSGW